MTQDDRFTEPDDEFGFLEEQARECGITGPLPLGQRVTMTLNDGSLISGLQWGEHPRVTFLHGAGLNAHTWDTTVAALGIDALALDLPGHGDSSWRADADYRGGTMAPAIAAAIERWTDGPPVVVGHSLGGLTAAALAATRPDLVARLIIVDITPGVDPSAGPAQIRAFFAGPTDWASRAELVDRALAAGLGGGTRRRAERGVYFNSRIRPDGRVEWKHHFAHLAAQALAPHTPDDAPAAPSRPLDPRIGWRDLAATRAPITLVRGERGFVTAADAEDFSNHLPGADVVTLATGHNPQEDDPLGLAAVISGLADDSSRPPEKDEVVS